MIKKNCCAANTSFISTES